VDAARLKLATDGAMLFYTVGRSYLLELYHSELQSYQVRIVDGPTTRRAYGQLMALETEIRVGGTPSAFELVGQHRFVRAQAAQAASKIWLGSLHVSTLRGSVKI
jgi:hypothetical protein